MSTSTVKQIDREAIGSVVGDWLVNGALDIKSSTNSINITGEVKENYTGAKMPEGVPAIDFANAKSAAKGSLKAKSVSIDKQHDGNLLIEGTDSDPIEIKGDVHVNGDVIIKGPYRGVGTIYASGNIFVPFDLIAKRSVFPFPDDREEALRKARASVSSGLDDGLGLATPGTVYIGDVDSGVIGALAIDTRSEVTSMYEWFGRDKFNRTLRRRPRLSDGPKNTGRKGVNVVDAFLYASRSIEGKADSSALSIRGRRRGLLQRSQRGERLRRDVRQEPGARPPNGQFLCRIRLAFSDRQVSCLRTVRAIVVEGRIEQVDSMS